MKLKKTAFLLGVLMIVAVTSSISYSYFTEKTDIQGNNGGLLQNLSITNGRTQIEINTEGSSWRYGELQDEDVLKEGETKVYIKKPDDWGDNLNVYIYRGNIQFTGTWPGTSINKGFDGIYRYTLNSSIFNSDSDEKVKVIFNDGNKQYPTPQEQGLILNKGEGKIYADGKWIEYAEYIKQAGVEITENGATIKNPDKNIKVNYNNVIIENKSNLTSKIRLDLDVYAEKINGSEEDSSIPPIDNDDITTQIPEGVKGFEITVGDIDNLGFGYSDDNFPFTGQTTSSHSLDITTEADDAPGTDRVMVTTGFWKAYNEIENKKFYYYYRQNNRQWPFKWESFTTLQNGNAPFYSFIRNDGTLDMFSDKKYPTDDNKVGKLTKDNGERFFDGYVEYYLRKNSLIPVQPITFKYDNVIDENEKIYSVIFQIMIDDLQAKSSDEMWEQKWETNDYNLDWLYSFSPKSKTTYTVTLRNINNGKEIKVEEFTDVINNLTQHGPIANLVSLNLPSKYYDFVKESIGAGLELKIDDENPTTTGDAYCIDFAKILVNKKDTNTAKIYGTIKDTKGNPIKNVIVTNNNTGEQVITDENGNYEFKYVSLGQTVIKAEHKNYITEMQTLYSVENRKEYNVPFILEKAYNNVPISPNTKFTGNIVFQKYDLNNNKVGDAIIKELKIIECGEENKSILSVEDILVEPGFYYKIGYNLSLFDMQSIDPNADKFSIRFKSKINAKITQENNPGWEETVQSP